MVNFQNVGVVATTTKAYKVPPMNSIFNHQTKNRFLAISNYSTARSYAYNADLTRYTAIERLVVCHSQYLRMIVVTNLKEYNDSRYSKHSL